MVGLAHRPGDDPLAVHANTLSAAAAESVPAHKADDHRSILRHARISRASTDQSVTARRRRAALGSTGIAAYIWSRSVLTGVECAR
jgi:hypothetical protein